MKVMTNNQRKIVIAGAIVSLALIALLLNPRIVQAALQLIAPTAAGVPTEVKVQVKPVNEQSIQKEKPLNEQSIQKATGATRPAIIGAKQKRIAEIRIEIAALVEELEALMADN